MAATTVFTNTAEAALLNHFVGKPSDLSSLGLKVGLITNASIPSAAVYTDFAQPTGVSGSGYAPITLLPNSWSVSTDSATGITSATYSAPVKWTATADWGSANTVTGYFLFKNDGTPTASTPVVMYQLDGTSYTFKNGSSYELSLTIRLG